MNRKSNKYSLLISIFNLFPCKKPCKHSKKITFYFSHLQIHISNQYHKHLHILERKKMSLSLLFFFYSVYSYLNILQRTYVYLRSKTALGKTQINYGFAKYVLTMVYGVKLWLYKWQ